jgi:hypothetical protein
MASERAEGGMDGFDQAVGQYHAVLLEFVKVVPAPMGCGCMRRTGRQVRCSRCRTGSWSQRQSTRRSNGRHSQLHGEPVNPPCSGRIPRPSSGATSLVLVPPQPPMHRLARHVVAARNLHYSNSIADHREHRLIPLLHDTQLHQHARECVADQAEPVSPIRRSHVALHPEPMRHTSGGTKHKGQCPRQESNLRHTV